MSPLNSKTPEKMQAPLHLLLLLLLCTAASASSAVPTTTTAPTSLVVSYCAQARYPSLCIRALAPSSPRTPTDLAVAAVSAALSSVSHTTSTIRHLPSLPSPLPGPLSDCFQQLSDSAEQLSKTKSELSSLKSETSRMQLDDACTYVSAALTNEDTCLDGMKRMDGGLKEEVGKKVRYLERMTSNALYFVTRLASDRGRKNP